MMTVAEVAAALGLSPGCVYQLCRAGRLIHHRLGVKGGRVMIAESDLEVYLESCRVVSAQARPTMTLRHVQPQR
jgi:excisionase family DNA binding protein